MPFNRFWNDQRGAMTMWLVMWSIIFIAFAGLAIDVSNLYRTRAMLQATADAGAHAGAVAIKSGGNAVDAVNEVTAENMPSATTKNNSVVAAGDIALGTWDTQTRTFNAGATPTDAVRVIARRTEATNNSLDTFLLRILDFDTWNVGVVAIATAMEVLPCDDEKYQNVLMSAGLVRFRSNNKFGGVLCVHGEDGIRGEQNNITIDSDVQFTMPDAGPKGTGNGQWDVAECFYQPDPTVPSTTPCNKASGGQMPWDAHPDKIERDVQAILDATAAFGTGVPPDAEDLALATAFGFKDDSTFKKVTNGNGSNAYKASDFTADLAAGIKYFRIDCDNPNNNFAIGSNQVMQGVTIVTDCSFSTPAGTVADNVTILTTSREGVVTRNENSDSATYLDEVSEDNGVAISFTGQPTTTGACGDEDQRLRLFAPGAISVTAQGDFSALVAYTGGNFELTAGNVVRTTVNIYAWGDIDWTSGGEFTPCSPTPGAGGNPFGESRRVNIVM